MSDTTKRLAEELFHFGLRARHASRESFRRLMNPKYLEELAEIMINKLDSTSTDERN